MNTSNIILIIILILVFIINENNTYIIIQIIIIHVINHFTNLTIFNYRQCYRVNYSIFCIKQTYNIVIYPYNIIFLSSVFVKWLNIIGIILMKNNNC